LPLWLRAALAAAARARRAASPAFGRSAASGPGLACGGSSSSDTDSNATGQDVVDTFDFGFRPKRISVPTGATITWENTGATT